MSDWVYMSERLPDALPLRSIEVVFKYKGVAPYSDFIGSSRIKIHLKNAYAWREKDPFPEPPGEDA